MERRRAFIWTLGAPEDVRLREREAMFVWVRWAFVGVGAAAALTDPGRSAVAAWSPVPLLAATNLLATWAPSRVASIAGLRLIGAGVILADVTAVTVTLFNYASNVDTATPLMLMLVVIEAAMRWELRGGFAGGIAAGTLIVVWMAHREVVFGVPFEISTAAARAGAYVLTGSLLGGLIGQLERGAREVHRHMRRTQAVGQFAVEAPRLSIDEAAERLAAVLERDLDFERAAVVVVADDRPSMFRLVATAGYEQERVEQYREFPVSLGVVGRAYRTGEPQLLETIESDPDYLDVDPTTRSEMAVPLRGRDTVFGVIDVASRRPAAFDADDLRFLETAAAQLGRAFDNARLAEMERQTIRELEELAAMQDDFIAIANHELRTPVTTIAGFAQSLLKQRDVLTQEEVDDAIERIARQSARLRSLIEDLLTAPREGDRGDRIALVPVTLAAVADEVVRELDPDDGRHRFLVRVAPDLPDVQADPEALRRVLTNLVSNAVKYSPEGGAVVVDAEPHPDEPERVRVAVRDEGIGIAPGDVPALFTKFGRIPKAAATSGGMGLGLFIVKELVEGMGGEVGVESAPGRGSCFWFTLDAARRTRPVGV